MVLHRLLKPFLLACGKVLWHICKVCIAVSWRNAPLDSSPNPSSQVDLRKQGKCQYQFYCSWETICCSPFAKRGKREWSHCNEFGHSLISLWLTHKLQFRLWLIVQDKEGSSRGNNTVSPSLGQLVKRHWNLQNTCTFLNRDPWSTTCQHYLLNLRGAVTSLPCQMLQSQR